MLTKRDFKIAPSSLLPPLSRAEKMSVYKTNMEIIRIEIKQKIVVICVQQQETIPISSNLELNKMPFITLSTKC